MAALPCGVVDMPMMADAVQQADVAAAEPPLADSTHRATSATAEDPLPGSTRKHWVDLWTPMESGSIAFSTSTLRRLSWFV